MGLGKVELHLHLDGSLDLPTAYRLAKERNVINDDMDFDAFKAKMMVPSNNPSLEECLKCFDFPIAIMQDKEALSECYYSLVKNLNDEGIIYAEIRFAPQVHCQKVPYAIAARKVLLQFRGIPPEKNPVFSFSWLPPRPI